MGAPGNPAPVPEFQADASFSLRGPKCSVGSGHGLAGGPAPPVLSPSRCTLGSLPNMLLMLLLRGNEQALCPKGKLLTQERKEREGAEWGSERGTLA